MILIFHLQAWPTMAAIYIVEIVLINNLGFKFLMVNSGTVPGHLDSAHNNLGP